MQRPARWQGRDDWPRPAALACRRYFGRAKARRAEWRGSCCMGSGYAYTVAFRRHVASVLRTILLMRTICNKWRECFDPGPGARRKNGRGPALSSGASCSLEVPGPGRCRRLNYGGTRRMVTPSADHQIFTRLSSGRTIASPALHWNALAKLGMFDGAPMARNFIGECGSALR